MDNNRCSVAVARRLAFAVLVSVADFPPPPFRFLVLKCWQACPENGVDIVPGRHIPEDSAPDPNPTAFDWGPSELVDEKEVHKEKKGGTRGLHLQTDYFSGGLASWGSGTGQWASHNYSGFTSTDVRMRPRHRYPPEQVECCLIFPVGKKLKLN